MLECVVNISEGRDPGLIEGMVASCGSSLLDLHADADHNRSVATLVGTSAPRNLAWWALENLDLGAHAGVHPRLGTIDVVPFVPLGEASMADAIAARDSFCAWAATELGIPCFLYGPERSLPTVRREAFRGLVPDTGPTVAHPRAGAICAGARGPLVAWNLWIDGIDLATTRTVASLVRTDTIRTLGLQTGHHTQVSVNLVDPVRTGPDVAHDAIVAALPPGARVLRSELVGLVPRAALARIDPARWSELDLDDSRTIEARLAG
ncbi:MAG: hypothetical protein FJW53_01365 [Actinobacteria bacterium]|nr:hypothetical protein [Actinomycetota bacterium]